MSARHGLKRDLLEMIIRLHVSLRITKFIFTKPIVPTVHRQECLEDEGVSSH